MTDAALRTLFVDAGYTFVEPPIVHPASVFVELAGEDLRRRLFLTAVNGTELALRPDYTIPVCLHHLATGASQRRADYAYLGPVFRQRQDEPSEFVQAGIESLGRRDRLKADADVMGLALRATEQRGIRHPIVRIGDAALFDALLKSLDLSRPWQTKLARTFGESDRLKAMIAGATASKTKRRSESRLGRAAAKRRASDLLAAAGLAVIGGRDADEIATRYVEKTALAKGIDATSRRRLTEYLAIDGRPSEALLTMRAFVRRNRLPMDTTLDAFEARLDAFRDRGIDVDRMTFAADFGRRLDYYTGFVFEMHRTRKRGEKPIVGGGRYDRLLAMIGDGKSVPAVGFAMWLDRFGVDR
ncbi:ATP phosphoribosyltransferase regulatory subunit [Bauldia sp.]|uniref:ATP phosphoribosyltransferase regulatory subunit n=1 Tax=Bauldia sp. TaxID=2575872 RepID=UPI003BA9A8D5